MNRTQVEEVQKLDTIWPLVAVAVPLVVNWILYFVFYERDMTPFYASMGTSLVLALLLKYSRLTTRWDGIKLSVQFRPFHFKPLSIDGKDILSAEICQYNPIRQFGGWGIRSSRKYGKAYSVYGSTGVQLTLKNGQKLLIGTNQPELWQELIREF
ncbi:MAG: hypothetical protein LW630_07455 [Saprospiraceae bacterium]|nr:hypothetical protein [Saprospiraceae bacterium]